MDTVAGSRLALPALHKLNFKSFEFAVHLQAHRVRSQVSISYTDHMSGCSGVLLLSAWRLGPSFRLETLWTNAAKWALIEFCALFSGERSSGELLSFRFEMILATDANTFR